MIVKNYLKLIIMGVLCLGFTFFTLIFSVDTSFAMGNCRVSEIDALKIRYVSSGKSNIEFKDDKISKFLHGGNIIFDVDAFYGKCVSKIENVDILDIKLSLNGKEFTGYADKISNGEIKLYIPYGLKGKFNMQVSLKGKESVKDSLSFDIVDKSIHGEKAVHPFYLFKNKKYFDTDYKNLDYKWDMSKRKYIVKLPGNIFNLENFEGWTVDREEYRGKIIKENEVLMINAFEGYCPIIAEVKKQNSWILENGNWMYLDNNGEIVKEKWIYDNKYNSWFYLKDNGKCAENEWIGGYYLKSGGYMAKSEWIYDNKYNSWFYLKDNGKYAENEWIGGYYLKSGGYMAKSEWIYDNKYNSWFYLKDNGKYAENEWIGNYYLTAGGYLLK